MPMNLTFAGKSALVAGAGGGMGLAIANRLIGSGVNVSMADIKEAPADIADGPGDHLYTCCDLTDEEEIARLVDRSLTEFGQLVYLVNTVGVLWFGKDKAVEDIEMDVWDRVFDINLRSIVMLVRKSVPYMKQNGFGAMVHFSSIDALSGDPVPQDAYGASKAALIRLSKSLGTQYAGHNIRSNVILPGPTVTPMQARWDGDPEAAANLAEHIPLGRLGKPADLADACMFLLSDQASYITATELVVDGGVTALP